MNIATHSEKPSGGDLGADMMRMKAGLSLEIYKSGDQAFREDANRAQRTPAPSTHETATWRSFGRRNLDNFGTNMFDARVDIEALPGQTKRAADNPTKI
jgi:hypothetical protein